MNEMRKLIDLCENAIQPITDWNDRNSVIIPLMKLRRVILVVKRMAEEYRTRYGDEASGAGGLLDAIEKFQKQFMICHPKVEKLKEEYLGVLVTNLTEAREIIVQFNNVNYPSYKKSKLYGEEMTVLFKRIREVANKIMIAVKRIEEIVKFK